MFPPRWLIPAVLAIGSLLGVGNDGIGRASPFAAPTGAQDGAGWQVSALQLPAEIRYADALVASLGSGARGGETLHQRQLPPPLVTPGPVPPPTAVPTLGPGPAPVLGPVEVRGRSDRGLFEHPLSTAPLMNQRPGRHLDFDVRTTTAVLKSGFPVALDIYVSRNLRLLQGPFPSPVSGSCRAASGPYRPGTSALTHDHYVCDYLLANASDAPRTVDATLFTEVKSVQVTLADDPHAVVGCVRRSATLGPCDSIRVQIDFD